MLNNYEYDKIKILHKLSCLQWFIKQHAEENAKKANNAECVAFYKELSADLEKHIAKLHKMVQK